MRPPILHSKSAKIVVSKEDPQRLNENNLTLQTNIKKQRSSLNFKRIGKSELTYGTRSDIESKEVETSITDKISDDQATSLKQNYDNDESLLVDVLPSFDMYNVLHRHIPQGNVNPEMHDFPPVYIEQNSTTSLTNLCTVDDISVNGRNRQVNDLEIMNTVHYSIPDDVQDDLNDNDNINIDKLYSLPKLNKSPIEIDIRITKDPAKPHTMKYEEQSMLKEYTSGDIVHGYCIISNQSSQKINFEMFYVTLEAYISVINKELGKRTVKRFLRMVDLCASWSYTDIDPSTGVDYVPGEIDHYDGSIIGLTNNRVLQPNTRYKKIFMFKLPSNLLDVTCKHEQFAHCQLPPSLSIDKFKNNFKYADIEVNDVLGCGHMGIKGTPILTNDLSHDGISINYTIDARIVGKDNKTKQLNILKEREFNLRFIPFAFSSLNHLNSNQKNENQICERQFNDLRNLIDERLNALDKVSQRLLNNEKITNSDIHGTDISGNIDSNLELNSQEILQRKLNQLHITNRLDDSVDLSRMKYMEPKANTVETQISYRFKPSSKSKTRNRNLHSNSSNSGFFSGLLGSSSSVQTLKSSYSTSNVPSSTQSYSNPNVEIVDSDNKEIVNDRNINLINNALTQPKENSGLIVLTANLQEKSLPYFSASLLKKVNKFELKNKHDQENWIRLSNLIPEETSKPLTNLPIQLTCILSNNSLPHIPPLIQNVTTELIVINAVSDNSIPVKLSTALLKSDKKLNDIKHIFKKYATKAQLGKSMFEESNEKLNQLFNIDRTGDERKLNFNDFISKNLMSDIDSIVNLKVNQSNLPDVFKKQPILDNTHWKQTGINQFEMTFNVALDINNKALETIVPSFETCLCARFYCLRVNVKFNNNIGSTSIDIPITVKSFHTSA